MTVAAVLVAAGSGERLGLGMPKALVSLHGKTILDWALSAFVEHADIDDVVVVAPATAVETLATRIPPGAAVVVPGGRTRAESVCRGLAVLPDRAEFVLVHDAARPLLPGRVISEVVGALIAGADAVIPVLPVIDTVKRVADGRVVETVDRTELCRVQTPQGFRLSALQEAYAAAPERSATDDAAVIEAFGGKVATVPGDEAAFKITTPHDLRLAELLVAAR